MARVLMLAFPEMQPLDFVGPYDLFRSVGVETVVVAENPDARLDDRLSVRADAGYDNAPAADAVMVPGGLGVSACLASAATLQFLAECRVKWYTSVCTGALLLGAAGLLRGYRATTHWRYIDLLELVGATPVEDARIVIDRNRITGGGVTAGIDFGLRLIAEICGENEARLAQLALEYAPVPPYAGTPHDALPQTRDAYEERTRERFDRRRAELLHAVERLNART
jgi:cyclohexyl-isocyanide hydratase